MDLPAPRPRNRHFAPGGEFALIEALFAEDRFSADGKGLGDDACLFEAGGETWAVTTDASVEGIHYRLDWAPPEAALAKCLLSNLSDINAMGGRPALAFLALGALAAWGEGEVARLGAAIRGLETRYGFRVAGGDTVRKAAESFFSFTLLGRVAGRPLLRSNARPGHGVYVSGTLGGSAAGLHLLERGARPGDGGGHEALLDAHLKPEPPMGLGPYLASLPGPVAAIDLSDGLSSELWHLSRQSGCRLTLDMGKLPYRDGLDAAAGGQSGLREAWALHGGEEYQLLFTGDFGEAELAGMREHARITRIGSVAGGAGVGAVDGAGGESELEPGGWTH